MSRRRDTRATGVFGSTFGLTVFLVFLLFAVQVLFGLYTRTTVTAVAADLAHRAAGDGDALTEERVAAYQSDGAARLGAYGDDVEFDFTTIDTDADGAIDTVAVEVRAALPILLPVRWSGYSPGSFNRTVRARLERFQGAP